MSNVLIRGRKSPVSPIMTRPKRRYGESIVKPGLSMTPSDIERLAKQGIAVSTPAADQFRYDDDGSSWNIDPNFIRDNDRNSIWELSKTASMRIMQAKRRDAEKFT